jgi:hypothetical protein
MLPDEDPFLAPPDSGSDVFMLESDHSPHASPVKPIATPQAPVTRITLPSNDTIPSPQKPSVIKQLPEKEAASEPSVEVEPPPATFEGSLLRYLDKSLRNATREFLDEFRMEIEQSQSIDSEIGQFLNELSTEVRTIVSAAVLPINDLRQRVTAESIRANFAEILRFPAAAEPVKWISASRYASQIDDANQAFVASAHETLNWLTEGRKSARRDRCLSDGDVQKRRRVLAGLAIDLGQCEAVLDELSMFFETQVGHLQGRQRDFRERHLLMLSEESGRVIADTESTWADLISRLREFAKEDMVSPLQELQRNTERFRDRICAAQDALDIRMDGITRSAKLATWRPPPDDRWSMSAGPDNSNQSGMDM